MKNYVKKSGAGREIPGPATAVRTHLNMPAFILNDEPFTKPVFETYAPEERYFKEFADAGCEVYSFSTNLGNGFGPPTWLGPDKWDFSELDARAHRVLAADPDGLIMPRILLSTPDWWNDANPNELMVLDDGSTAYDKDKSPRHAGRSYASIASEKWRKDMADALRYMIEHIQNSDYANHMFGYMVTGLFTEEWYHWSSGFEQVGDYSEHYVRVFRKWLRQKYGTVEKLRDAWNDPSADFNSAAIPSKAERFGDRAKTFRDPETEMKVIDFYLFHNEIIPDTIGSFAGVAKDATGGTKVVGTFYGFMFEFCGDPEFGHNAMSKFIRSPNLDFMMVTASYGHRQLGTGLDYAEGFDVSSQARIPSGTVLIIDEKNPGKLKVSEKAYDHKVVGIAAGANGLNSGVRLGAGQFDLDVALAGRVYCNVDATYGKVSPGDLLTTSPTPGYAMVVKDYTQAQGCILGKAMQELADGQRGQILVLVTLQ